jgi:hypothetical protein
MWVVTNGVPEGGNLYDGPVNQARQELGMRYAERISSVFAYGAVELDPKYLVVWVLLAGDPDAIPVWYFPGSEDAEPAQCSAELLAEIDTMRALVVETFSRADWPDAEHIQVGFESDARVKAQGGLLYFR